MSDILFSMATEYESGVHKSNAEAMAAALLWLADNLTDELVAAGLQGFIKPPRDGFASDSGSAVCVRGALIAALRAAADGGEK